MQNTNEAIISLIIEHLTTIEENFGEYLPLLNSQQIDWIRNPPVSSDFSNFTLDKIELTSFSSDRGLKSKFIGKTHEKFRIYLKSEYLGLGRKALNTILLISAFSLCNFQR